MAKINYAKVNYFNSHTGRGGSPELVDSHTETLQNASLSVPELLKRAMLGTVDSSGFIRVPSPDDYDSMNADDYKGLDNYNPSPTFGQTYAEAEEYIGTAKRQAKNEVDAYNDSHKEEEQQDTSAKAEDVQSLSM